MPRNTSPYEMFLAMAREHRPRHRFTAGADVAAWRAAALPDVLATLGRVPEPVAPDPELLAEWEEDGVVSQRWLIDVSKGLSAYAYINRPAGADRSPGLLCWHGHSEGGKDAVMNTARDPHSVTDYGRRMAGAGFATFAMDWMGYGDQDDTRKPNHRAVAARRDWCNVYYLHATMLGMTPLGINLAHGRALVDFAAGLSFVDEGRIGVMGLSGGGTMTLWSALTDERLRAAEIICYSDVFADFGFRDINYCGSQITPGLYDLVDVADLQGLLAPRPLLVDIGIHDDCFRIESAMACHERVGEIYQAAGVRENLQLDLFPGGHGWGGNRSVEFFTKHL